MPRATMKAMFVLGGAVALAAALSIGAALRLSGNAAPANCSLCHTGT
jgi:hypothetical protein